LPPKLVTFSQALVAGINGVQIGPGATLFTRIPRSPHTDEVPAARLPKPSVIHGGQGERDVDILMSPGSLRRGLLLISAHTMGLGGVRS
jgi:hypothetical protein